MRWFERLTTEECIYSRGTKRSKRSNLRWNRLSGTDKRLGTLESRPRRASYPISTSEEEILYEKATPNLEYTEDVDDKVTNVQIAKYSSVYYLIEQDKIEFQGYSIDCTFIQGLRKKLGDGHGDVIHRKLPLPNQVASFFKADNHSEREFSLPLK